MAVGGDRAHAKLKETLDAGGDRPQYFKAHMVYYAGPAKKPDGLPSGSFGPTTAGRMESYVELFQSRGGSLVMLAKGNRSQQVRDACKQHGGFYLGSIGGPAARLAEHSIKKVEVLEYPELGMEAIWRIEVEDFPAVVVVDHEGKDIYAELAAKRPAPLVPLALVVLFTGYTVILNFRLRRNRAASVEDRYRAVFDAMPTPILVVDGETGRYLECNEASRQFTGLPRGEFIGRRVGDLLEPEDRMELEALLREAANAPTRTLLRRWTMQSGREFFSEMALTPVEFGGREAVVMAGRDRTAEVQLDEERREYAAKLQREVAQRTQDLERTNTKLRELQTRLVEAERLGIAGEVAGGIAHAIYNPLAALIGHMEMKLDSDKVDPRDEHVMHLARRIEAVVEGMLTLSRRGTMRPEPMDLGDLVREVRRELAERCLTQGVEVELRIAPDLPQLTADRALLTTALLSVAENAVDAMEKGGKLVLEVESVSKTAAVRLRVRDSGAGVPAKIRGRIFEPFYSTKPRGVGLGLAIARGIILGHEGSIRLESEPGIGTEVTLEIPQQGVREARR